MQAMDAVAEITSVRLTLAEGWVARRALDPRGTQGLAGADSASQRVCWVLRGRAESSGPGEEIWVFDHDADSPATSERAWRYLPTGRRLADLGQGR